jgi:E3 ubiquitin-protein ligase RGLG
MLQSNEWMGKESFFGRSLHHLGPNPNPYEQAITIIGKTLASFDDDQLIPAYGFGDGKRVEQQQFAGIILEAYCWVLPPAAVSA